MRDISDLINEKCCGCLICKAVCPTKAIDISEDQEHFLVPKVNLEKCINCGKCTSVCPEKNIKTNSQRSTRVFSAYSLDDTIREKGSSGSIFYLLAEKIIEQGGIVYGATMENLKVKHIGIKNKKDIEKLCKSKYVQSNLDEVWEEILANIKKDMLVMFVGTPCQNMALYNTLAYKKENLLLVDFICHGTPNQWLFDKNIAYIEKTRKIDVLQYEFRAKSNKFSGPLGLKLHYRKEGKLCVDYLSYFKDIYYFNFKKYNCFRFSCYACQFATQNRISDITLGDFWGIEKFEKTADFKKGVSIICSHTLLGEKYLKLLENNIGKEYSEEVAKQTNHSYTKTTKMPKSRKAIYYDADKMSCEQWGKKYKYSPIKFYSTKIVSKLQRLLRK